MWNLYFYMAEDALRSHETNETGRIQAPLTGRIRDQKKLGLTFYGIGLKFWRTHVNTGLFRGLICTVQNWNELDNAMKPGQSN